MLNRLNSDICNEYYLAAGMLCARRISEQLDVHWDGPENGMNRLTMTDRETEGLDILTREAQGMGMQAYELLSGSRVFIYPGEDATLAPNIIGSHIDSVKKGGKHDGPAGIIAGMATVASAHARFLETGIKPKRTIVVLAERGEESTEYNQFGIGSGMNTGEFGPEVLKLVSTSNGKTWEENARAQGIDVDALRKKLEAREHLIPLDLVHHQAELHIEQGKKLATANIPIGIVTEFRGNVRYAGKVMFKGRADHTGATEMEDRLDAGDAVADFRAEVKREAEKLRAAGHDMVYTFHFATDDDRTSIPENAGSAVEARSKSPETLKLFEAIVETAARNQELKGYGVSLNENKVKRTAPVSLDNECQPIIKEVAANLNVATMPMVSGAGHDLMRYAKFVPCVFISVGHGNGGLSHNPGEILGMTPEQDPYVEGNYPTAVKVVTEFLTRDDHTPSTSPRSVAQGDFKTELVKRGAKPLALAA